MTAQGATQRFDTRPFQPGDEEQVLGLLAQGLPRWAHVTSDILRLWRWKHRSSPFGPSFVRVAHDERGAMVGTFAMMPWRLRRGDNVIRAARGVDLVTHPAHRGMGVADMLSKDLADVVKADGTSLLFHTPNQVSFRISMKRGRRFLGVVGPSIRVRHIPRLLARRAGIRLGPARDRPPGNGALVPVRSWLDRRDELEELLDYDFRADRYRTERTLDYLRWRYAEHPAQAYYVLNVEEGSRLLGSVILRVSAGATANGVFIQEILMSRRDSRIARALRKRLEALPNLEVFSACVSHDPLERAVLGSLGVFRAPRSGYMLTVGALDPACADAARGISAWGLTLGDLDGF